MDAATWFSNTRPRPRQLARFRARTWPATAPRFAVAIRLLDEGPNWLAESLRSLAGQTYGNWQAVVAIPHSVSAEVRAVLERQAASDHRLSLTSSSLDKALRGSGATYYCFLDHGDVLEPHALHRLAEAVLHHPSDLLYSDEALTGESTEAVQAVEVRPAFSYDLYLAHEYFKNLLTVRAGCVAQAGGLGDANRWGCNQDFVLRVLEHSQHVSHLPEILYRRRCHVDHRAKPNPPRAAEMQRQNVARHLRRLGLPAVVQPTAEPDCRDVQFRVIRRGQVGIIIPTRNHGDLLRRCIESLEATLRPSQASILVLDHESDEPATVAYLSELRQRWPVLPYRGTFNFSAMMNAGADHLRHCDYYLFLNNDTEALEAGWLDHMVGLAQREDVGVVGAVLLYPDRTVQHAGVVVGFRLAAEHLPKGTPTFGQDGSRLAGPSRALLATRDQSAVTGACLLMRSEVFRALGGFDERLAVGFGDTDLCLRARAAGYKVLLDAQAVLLHHESATRPTHMPDPHPTDTRLFRARYLDLLLHGDPTYSQAWSYLENSQLNGFARAPQVLRPRVAPVVLPHVATGAVLGSVRSLRWKAA
ncbi:MAG: glycosyltransferase family 2 protein [Planctomycetia bacterium]|nr:glycosyltransferase family 2 protein [Planctomycetia bacterium]